MTAPVFVVEEMPSGPGFVLEGPEGRHAVSVKRLQPGEDVVLTDGLGHWAEGVVRAAEGKDRLVVTVEAVREEELPAPGSPSSRPCPRETGARSPSRR